MAQTTLITGATGQLGRELAKLAAADRCDLVLVARRQDQLDELAHQLANLHDIRVKVIPIDLAQSNAAEVIYNHLENWQWGVDVLINNASTSLHGSFTDSAWADDAALLQLNVVTPTQLMKLLLPGMKNRRFGRVLNVASTAAFAPGPNLSVYYASKAYLLSLSEGVREELHGSGVTVTTLCPGLRPEQLGNTKNKHIPDALVIATAGYESMKKGQAIVTPGLNNKLFTILPRLLPRAMVSKTLKYAQKG